MDLRRFVWCCLGTLAFALLGCGGHGARAGTTGTAATGAGRGGGASGASAGGAGGAAGTSVAQGGAGARGTGGSGGGSGGGRGGGSGGAAGSAALADDAACTPATQRYADSTALGPLTPDCSTMGLSSIGPESRIVNPAGVDFAEEIPLDTKLAAGVPAALSVRLRRDTTPGTFEVWGGNGAACGPVDELLWWTDIESRRICGEFTPSAQVTRLVFVWRMQEKLKGSFDFSGDDISICAAGSCPAQSGGHGLLPGATLTAPVGVYKLAGENLPWAIGVNYTLGDYGHFIARYLDNNQGQMVRPLPAGIVRMPPYDPFGDAWYCLGDGSTITRDSNTRVVSLQLRGLTKLRSCEGGAGTGSASITITNKPNLQAGTADVTASDADFSMTGADMAGACEGTSCSFQFTMDPSTTAMRISQLYVSLAADVGTYSSPTLKDAAITSATFIYVPSSGPMKLLCISGGSIHYDPSSQTKLTLTGVSSAMTCPGATVDPNMLDIRTE